MIANPLEIREKIKIILKTRGPSLPVHISKETGLEMLFASAFLSELASEKEIKISNMKVGGSPLYFLPGQEMQLENFSSYLHGKEKEAFLLLKERKILQDSNLEPAIRVALRSLKDFAFPFLDKDKILYWRFHSIPEQEIKLLLPKIEVKPKIEIKKIELSKPEIQIKPIEKQQETIKEKKIEKPLITLKPTKEKKPKQIEKSDFVNKVVFSLITENIEILEEKEIKKKEFTAIVKINSDIGKIKFFLIAKDKKSITENDLAIALQKAQALKMPAYLIATGKLNKKALTYLESYSSLLKFKQL